MSAERSAAMSPWAVYKSMSYGHLGPGGKAYYFYVRRAGGVGSARPRDVDGYPVLSQDSPQIAVDYAREHGFPLPGENALNGGATRNRAARRQGR